MKHSKLFMALGLVLAIVSQWGCMDLAVENLNNPDRQRAITSPKDVESIISGSFLEWWTGTQKDANRPALTLSTMADAHTSSWGNWGMQDLSSEPRTPFNNSPSYVYEGVASQTWYNMYRAISSVNDGLQAINGGMKIMEGTTDNTARARAFAKFVQGLSHLWLACFFDRAFIYDETMDVLTTKFELKPYTEVFQAGVRMLEEAIAICNANTFTIPNTWINGITLTNTQLKEVAYSHLARYRAGVARTPTERAAVDWNKVISDARNGVKADWGPIGDGNLWWDGLKFRGQHGATWTRADYKTIGQTDKSGRYRAWLETPVANRNVFVIDTDDRRITGAGGGTTNGTDFKYLSPSPFRDDRGTYHHSLYYHARYEYHVLQGATGAMTSVKVAEMDLLVAEGLWRTGGSLQEICDLINKTRVTRGQLPPVTPTMGRDEIFKWLQYEKMIETFATGGGIPWFDRRGWLAHNLVYSSPGGPRPGETQLPPGTLIHFPVPGKELEVLQMAIYTFGGVGGPGAAPKRDLGILASLRSVRPE